MTIKSVRLSITIASLAADAPEVVTIAGMLQMRIHADHSTGHDAAVTRDANWIKCGKLSVFVRNIHATAENIDQLTNLLRVQTQKILTITERPSGQRVIPRSSPDIRATPEDWCIAATRGITVAVEWMGEQMTDVPKRVPAGAAWVAAGRALIGFAHRTLLH